jgi:hypothetical protein
MKTAYELAMERLEKSGGKRIALSDEQKKAIAEIDRQMTAKIAEIEIMSQKAILQARASGDAEKIAKAERQKLDDIQRAKARAEADKDRIRSEAANP